MRMYPQRSAAFSLVEIVLALGIVSFAIVSLVGLLSLGLITGKESMEDVRAANLASTILAQRRAAPTVTGAIAADYALPPLNVSTTQPQVIFLTQEGVPTAQAADKYYRMTYRVTAGTVDDTEVYLSLSAPWPATDPNAMSVRYELLTHVNIR